MNEHKIVIVGAGPAGLSCAYTLSKYNKPSTILEKELYVGGLCHTLNFYGYSFDIGGHRFFTKIDEVKEIWFNLMGEELVEVKRSSRIYYKKRFFKYPLSFFDTFLKLGPLNSILCIGSFFIHKYLLKYEDNTFDTWITKRFGKRLYEIFFKSYTEKLWGIAPENISAAWAIQRIRGLSLRVAIKNAIFKGKNLPKTLSESFLYPIKGAGDFYDKMKNEIEKTGLGEFHLGKKVVKIKHENYKIKSIIIEDTQNKSLEELSVDYLFSTIPLPNLINSFEPSPPPEIIEASSNLNFRGILVVNVILNKKDTFPDQWIYIQDPDVKLGRVQNYKNWSPYMISDPNKTTLGLEYFCTAGDSFWEMNDMDLIDYAMDEIDKIGLVSRKYLINGFVSRHEYAYPIYSLGYEKFIEIIKNYLSQFENFQTFGRQGTFQYDNMDKAMISGSCAAKNFLKIGNFDLWNLNANKEYLEC